MDDKNKLGTVDTIDEKLDINNFLSHSDIPELDSPDDVIDNSPILIVDLSEVNTEAEKQAKIITEKLSNYYFDEKYIDNHPYIPVKIAQEMNNIRRLLKMLSINEKAQDALIKSISINAAKSTLFQSLTSLQNAMLAIQNQLNILTNNVESIFKEMQDNCEKTFEEKEKEQSDDGSVVARGSREFILNINSYINNDIDSENILKEIS